jgi:PAS domain S-box-containing protein
MGIQSRLMLLLLIVIVPILCAQALIHYDRYHTRKARELQANMELARAASKAFEAFVRDVLHQELAIAFAAGASPSLTPGDFTRLLEQFAKGTPAVRDFHWVSPEGRVLASSASEAVGIDCPDMPYFKKIEAGRDWMVSDLFISKATGEPVFNICRGVRDRNGALLGVVVAAVDPERLDSVLTFERSGDAGVSLLDSKGMHVYRYPAAIYTWEQRNWLGLYPVMEEALEGKEVATTLVSKTTGTKRLVGFTHVAPIGWVAAASRAESEAMESVNSGLLYHAVLFLVVTAIAFGVGLTVSRSISTHVRRLRDHAIALGYGEMEKLAAASGPVELKDLAGAFNEMAAKVLSRESALQEREERLRLFIEHAPASLAMFDRRMRYLSASRRWLSDYNLGERDLTGLSHYDVFPEISEEWKAVHQRALAGEVLRAENDRFDRTDGSVQWLRWEVRPWHDASGDIGGIVVFTEDTTARKLAEDALRQAVESLETQAEELRRIRDALKRSNDELEERVQERTATLAVTNNALREYARKLERLNRDLEDFSFVATHDLQEPLRKIQTFGDRLQSKYAEALGEEGRDYLERMIGSAGRMSDLIRSVRAYAGITTRGRPFQPTELSEVAVDAVRSLGPVIEETGAGVEVGELPAIEADAVQMQEVLYNLLSNALKYRREEQLPVVKIHSRTNGSTCCIYVEDNGIGFDEALSEKIFRPFQRLHPQRAYGGTGMGLAICRKIVELHGGTITARSTPGEGSTFILSLPISQGEGRGRHGLART